MHATGGILNRNPSQRAAADPRLRPRGHRDPQKLYHRPEINQSRFQDKNSLLCYAVSTVTDPMQVHFLSILRLYCCTLHTQAARPFRNVCISINRHGIESQVLRHFDFFQRNLEKLKYLQ